MTTHADLLAILDAASYAVVALDLNCRVLYLNKSARLFLHKRGRYVEDCIGCEGDQILPLATPKVRKALTTAEFKAGVGRMVDKGNQLFYEITPLMQDGKLAGAVVSLQRPERFEQMACNLETYQNLALRLQTIFDSSSDGIWVSDENGVVLDINNASEKLNGVNAATLRGQNVRTLLERGLIDDSVTVRVLQTKRQQTIIQNIKKTGRQLLVTGTPAFNDRGELYLVVANERDITDLNVLQENLEQARRAQEKVQRELEGLTMLEYERGGVVAESKSMRRVLMTCLKLAQLEATTLLLLGESGTGKGLLAKFIHKSGPRQTKPFISVNCAALPDSLFEAELFGYEKGAFTGALETGRVGLMELAGDGTLFLDEVGEISPSGQAKLLKALDEREFLPLGSNKPRPLECNIIAATNRDLKAMTEAKKFREDLLYRLKTFTVSIPPLRERREDLFELVTLLLKQNNERYGTHKRITPRFLDTLQQYPFPGNVRELTGLIRQGVVMCDDVVLDDFLEDQIGNKAEQQDAEATTSLTAAVDAVEREMLIKARAVCHGTREMATYLGISQPTVVRKLRRHGIRPPRNAE
ncbi:sigma 54-interacting transcriptional regulator [Nitratidesulfovibrio termitidis]|uniref:sigma 54-interacting transcriptional regulator n=1 Tax=Nitratidesulfovibrio termitidis TaxID=42252 RepID=UPI000421C240|nr:sigma 54-interacting transcriptional regulator [Nitratidesulfovibrio termitidis]